MEGAHRRDERRAPYGFHQGVGHRLQDTPTTTATHEATRRARPTSRPLSIQALRRLRHRRRWRRCSPAARSHSRARAASSQDQDELINVRRMTAIRFGLMTIDSDTLPNTGVSVTARSDANTHARSHLLRRREPRASGNDLHDRHVELLQRLAEDRALAPGWTARPSPRGVRRETASSGQIFYEVGARNPAAPPWEGRLMRFPSGTDLDVRHDEQPEHCMNADPRRDAPLRREPDRQHDGRREVLPSGRTRRASSGATRSRSAGRSTSSSSRTPRRTRTSSRTARARRTATTRAICPRTTCLGVHRRRVLAAGLFAALRAAPGVAERHSAQRQRWA